MRIVSLLPSATEIVCALGFADTLVGRSHECDYPKWVEQLPICSEPNFILGSSRDIDQHVQTALQQALSIYHIHNDVIKGLQPDFIITQTQCEVCAVSLRDVQTAACEWLDVNAQIVSLEPNGLDDVFADIERVAVALGIAERGKRQVEAMRKAMNNIAAQTQDLPHKPGVACIEWLDPLIVSGNWMPQLVDMAGGINLFSKANLHSPRINWDVLQAQNPHVIVLLPCGFSIERGKQDLPLLMAQSGWSDLKAVREGRVYLTDGHQYFNRPGPRLVDSLEILAEIFHPEQFHFGHEGTGWIRL